MTDAAGHGRASGRGPGAPQGAPPQEERLDRILTVPNAVTLARLACIPVFVWLLFGRDDRAAAAYLLAALGITDWVDGYLARRLHQVSTLGKILDPAADRLLLGVGVVSILVDGSVPLAVAVLTIVREVVVTGAALVLATMGARRIDVTMTGKAGTFGLMVAYPLFLAGASDLSWADTADVLAWICVVPGLVLSYVAAGRYIPLGKAALAESRSGGPVPRAPDTTPAGGTLR